VHLIPLRYLVPLLALLDLVASLLVSLRARSGVRWDEMRRVIPTMLLGSGVGAVPLAKLPEGPLLFLPGAILVAYASYALLRRGGPPRFSALWGPPTGFTAGALASMYGNGGLVTALYIGGRLEDKDQLRATAAAIVVINAGARTLFFAATGLLSQDALLLSAALLLPSLLAGLFLGGRLHAVVPARLVVRAIHLIVALAGLLLLIREAFRWWT